MSDLRPGRPLKPTTPSGDPSGVRGWLLFVCISWTTLAPAVSFFAAGQALNEMGSLQQHSAFVRLEFPTFFPGMTALVVISIATGIYSLISGVWLWRVKSGALANAQRFLIYMAVANVVTTIVSFIVLVPVVGTDGASEYITDLVRSLAWVGIWMAYFHKSERVAATYRGVG